MNNGHEMAEDARTRAIVETMKDYVGRRLSALPAPPASMTNKTEVVFPAEELARVLAAELSKAMSSAVSSITWPQPKTEVGETHVHAPVTVSAADMAPVAEALRQIGELIQSTPVPMVEAQDMSPLLAVAQEIRDGNDKVAKLIVASMEQQARALEALVKAVATGRNFGDIVVEHGEHHSTIRRK